MISILISVISSRHIESVLDAIAFIETWAYAMGIFFSFITESRKTLKAILVLGLIAMLLLWESAPILSLSVLPSVLIVLHLNGAKSK